MKWIASLSLLLALAGGVRAAGTDDQYLDVLGQILQADSLQESGHMDSAAVKYLEAQDALQKLHSEHPNWNEAVIDFRLEYLAGKLKQLGQYLPAATNAPAVVTANSAPPQQVAALQAQIDALTAANVQMQQKVKEALSIQPAAIAPSELAKEQQKNVDLQKERDLLIVALKQQKAAPAPVPASSVAVSSKLANELAAVKKQADQEARAADAEIAEIKRQMEESKKKLADANAELSTLKSHSSSDDVKSLTNEKNKLADELAALKAQFSKDAKAAKFQMADLQKQMEESKKMQAASAESLQAGAGEKDKLAGELAAQKTQIENLQRQVEVSKQMLAASAAELNTLKSRPSSDEVKSLASEKDKLGGELAALEIQSGKETKAARSQIDDLQHQVDASKKMLAETTDELNTLKSHPASADVNTLTIERDNLKKDLAAKSKELADREAHAAVVSPASSQDAIKLKQVEQERDNLAKQLAAMPQAAPGAGAGESSALAAENKGLRAELAVLEAAPVPLTAQELAILNAPPSAPATPPATTPAPTLKPVSSMELTHKAHSLRDLPQGTGGLMTEALRSAANGDYATAEKKFLQVLAQDQDNVYVLVNLGDAQFAEGHLDDCEKNVTRALALDPNDPGALYLLGILRYRQDKLDDALDALSRSASLNSTNSSTQNYLGCVLFAKGLPAKAETALRKALEIEPDYADAHYNLALVYAKEQPPSLALAKWHYQRAIAMNHPKNSELEKILAGGQ